MGSAKIKLPFGLNKNNTIIHVTDVERGKKCNCVCPSCRVPLIAAKGNKKQHHFKHATGNECEHGLESAIHLAAKQIIKEKNKITLPQCDITVSQVDSKNRRHTEQETIVQDGTVIENFDSIDEEIELYGMKADLLATKGSNKLIIEIFYRHKVEDQKIEKIKNANISAIEIDLSKFTPEDIKNWETFWSSINNPENIQWLHNIKASDDRRKKLEIQLEKEIQEQEEKYKKEEIEKQKKEQYEKKQLLQALEDLKPLCSKEYVEQLKQKAEAHPIWEHTKEYLSFSWHELPDFVNKDVPNGDWIFGCDRRVWQTAFYSSFIYRNGNPLFCIKSVDNWLQNKKGLKVPNSAKIVGIYAWGYRQLVPDDLSRNIPSSWKTLESYFFYLRELGMLEFSGGYKGNYWFKILSKNPV